MNGSRIIVAAASAMAAGVASASDTAIHPDLSGDAVVRRTDPGAVGEVANLLLPDIVSVSLSGWVSATAVTDPFHGSPVEGSQAHLVRLDVVLRGLFCPPGTLGLAGFGHQPREYGANPLFGFIELDMDRDIDTGGEFGGAAANRYLANVGRFGMMPAGASGLRAARRGSDIDLNFNTGPQYERSGADFALTFCGCFHTTIAMRIAGNSDDVFEAGEAWVVRGRFFQRAGGYQQASFAFGGSAFGLYDPFVNVRFAHNESTDQTTISLVYPLTMQGAATLSGQPLQPPDSSALNHTSVFEALLDVIAGAENGGLSGPTEALASGWAGKRAEDYLDPTTWKATALVGAAYAEAGPTLYVWTDTLGAACFGDFDRDGDLDIDDRNVFRQALAEDDGGSRDCDGSRDGVVTLCIPGSDWSVFDLNGDWRIDQADLNLILPACVGDINADRRVDFVDLGVMLSQYGWVEPSASDLNDDGVVDFIDLNILLSVFGTACAE